MSTAEKKDTISEAEYFAILEQSKGRYELIDGQMYAMTGGSRNHHRLIRKLSRLLDTHLEHGSCEVLSEFMLRMTNTDYFFPDLLVECDAYDDVRDYATKPKMIIEVLSESTMNYDLSGKFEKYKTLESLEEYVIVQQSCIGINIFRKADDWRVTRYSQGDEVEFKSIDLTVPIAEIYDRIVFAEDIMNKNS